jgi:hypothetical protein
MDHDEFPSGCESNCSPVFGAIPASRYSTFGVWPYSIPPG